MTFANISASRQQLTSLSQMLITAFPGCTIHQSRDMMRALQHVSSGKVDVVFADAQTCSDLIPLLRQRKLSTSVYLLCPQDLQAPEETGGICGVVTYPLTTQKIQIALQHVPQVLREAI